MGKAERTSGYGRVHGSSLRYCRWSRYENFKSKWNIERLRLARKPHGIQQYSYILTFSNNVYATFALTF